MATPPLEMFPFPPHGPRAVNTLVIVSDSLADAGTPTTCLFLSRQATCDDAALCGG